MKGLEPTVPGRKKVVVVEDDPDTRELELFLLAAEGYEVTGVGNGTDAAEVVRSQAADLVLLDLMLPGKDGVQVLEDLEREPATAATPVIVISAYANRLARDDAVRRARQVRQVVAKPFDVGELLGAVARAVGATP
jgi:CheY-like chemotaxis protein